jgi:hypothetical protein
MQHKNIVLIPDAGPLITLAYADALDTLFKPSWTVQLVDMVQHEVTRNQTPTSEKLAKWIKTNMLAVRTTKTFQHYKQASSTKNDIPRKSNLGEIAIQEMMNEFALLEPPTTGVFLFEDHKIARASFMVPKNCRKISTRAFLIFLEQKGLIESSADIERRAISAGRMFSRLRFPAENYRNN